MGEGYRSTETTGTSGCRSRKCILHQISEASRAGGAPGGAAHVVATQLDPQGAVFEETFGRSDVAVTAAMRVQVRQGFEQLAPAPQQLVKAEALAQVVLSEGAPAAVLHHQEHATCRGAGEGRCAPP